MSKADKLRRIRIRQQSKPGPKPKEGDRYPSGDLRPYETERETMAVVMAQRAKLGYDLDQQKDERAGYTLGRMLLDGKITSAEFEGGQWFIEHMERYYRATGIPSPNPRAQDLTRVQIKGHDGELSESQQERVRKATNMMMKMTGTLLKCANGGAVKSTVFNVCVMDMEGLRLMPEGQRRLLKDGLRALAMMKGMQ